MIVFRSLAFLAILFGNPSGANAFDGVFAENKEERALKEAVEGGNVELAARLLTSGAHKAINGARVDPRASGYFLAKLLAQSSERGRLPMVKLLMKYDAYVEHSTWQPVFRAAYKNHPEVAIYMLDHGASPNEYGGRDFGYRTLLELAASHGYLELVRKLIEKEVTLVDRSRGTARNIQEPGERAANAAKLYGYFDIAATIKEAMRPPNQPSLKSLRRRM